MLSHELIPDVVGSTAYDRDGEKIGKVQQVFVDDRTGDPAFASVQTGLFGRNASFVPIDRADLQGEDLKVPYTKDQVKDAPNIEPDAGHLEPSQEQHLYSHYGIAGSDGRADGQAHGTGTPTTSKSKETVEVDSVEREGGGRLRRYVTTEYETRAVPVRTEHVEVEEDDPTR